MGNGQPGRIRSLLEGYGIAAKEIGPELAHQLMTLMLLHRYSEPLRQVRIDGWPESTRTLRELERLIWPL